MIGRIINNYEIRSLLGEGGMGTVYLCEHTFITRRVAVKVLRRMYCEDQEMVARFMNEARAANAIGHPNIIDIIDVGRLEDEDPSSGRPGLPYLMMECLDGETLAQRLRRVGKLPLGEALAIARQATAALGAAHAAGIVHRDLKPENLFLAGDAMRGIRLKLLDFGIAKLHDVAGANPVNTTSGLLGTPAYMSPEQVRGPGVEIDARADIYAVGILLYEMLCGEVPFSSPNPGDILMMQLRATPRPPRSLTPELPVWAEQIIERALAKDPRERFASMEAMSAALESGAQWRMTPDWRTVVTPSPAVTTSAVDAGGALPAEPPLGEIAAASAGEGAAGEGVIDSVVDNAIDSAIEVARATAAAAAAAAAAEAVVAAEAAPVVQAPLAQAAPASDSDPSASAAAAPTPPPARASDPGIAETARPDLTKIGSPTPRLLLLPDGTPPGDGQATPPAQVIVPVAAAPAPAPAEIAPVAPAAQTTPPGGRAALPPRTRQTLEQLRQTLQQASARAATPPRPYLVPALVATPQPHPRAGAPFSQMLAPTRRSGLGLVAGAALLLLGLYFWAPWSASTPGRAVPTIATERATERAEARPAGAAIPAPARSLPPAPARPIAAARALNTATTGTAAAVPAKTSPRPATALPVAVAQPASTAPLAAASPSSGRRGKPARDTAPRATARSPDRAADRNDRSAVRSSDRSSDDATLPTAKPRPAGKPARRSGSDQPAAATTSGPAGSTLMDKW